MPPEIFHHRFVMWNIPYCYEVLLESLLEVAHKRTQLPEPVIVGGSWAKWMLFLMASNRSLAIAPATNGLCVSGEDCQYMRYKGRGTYPERRRIPRNTLSSSTKTWKRNSNIIDDGPLSLIITSSIWYGSYRIIIAYALWVWCRIYLEIWSAVSKGVLVWLYANEVQKVIIPEKKEQFLRCFSSVTVVAEFRKWPLIARVN